MQRFLQICPHDVAPFGELCDRYREAAALMGAEFTTVFIAPPEHAPRDGAIYLNSADMGDTRAIAAALEAELQGEWDLALCHRYRAYWAFVRSRLTARETVALAHDYGMMSRWQRRWNRRLFARHVKFAGVASDLCRELASDIAGEAVILPNALNVEARPALSREAARERLGVAADVPLIGFVGRLHYKKRPNLALQAFRIFAEDQPAAQMVFMGDGEERGRLADQSRENVTLTGFVEDAPSLFRAFDVLLHTARKEAFGMVVLEAMAAGVPVVTLKRYGPEYVLDDLGFYAASDDAAAFAAAIPEALASDRDDYARACRERVREEFSPQAIARALDICLAR